MLYSIKSPIGESHLPNASRTSLIPLSISGSFCHDLAFPKGHSAQVPVSQPSNPIEEVFKYPLFSSRLMLYQFQIHSGSPKRRMDETNSSKSTLISHCSFLRSNCADWMMSTYTNCTLVRWRFSRVWPSCRHRKCSCNCWYGSSIKKELCAH